MAFVKLRHSSGKQLCILVSLPRHIENYDCLLKAHYVAIVESMEKTSYFKNNNVGTNELMTLMMKCETNELIILTRNSMIESLVGSTRLNNSAIMLN